MSAVAASGAQAASSLDVGVTPSVGTGEIVSAASPHTLTAGKAVVKCEVANLEGTLTGTNVTEGTVTATYSKCKLAGTAMEVRMNGCKYTLTNTATALTLNVDVVECTTGKVIEIKSLTTSCTITVKEQGPLSSVVGENVVGSSPAHIKAVANVTGIHAVFDGTECPEPNGTTIATSSFKGDTTLKAFADSGLGAEKEEFGHKFKPFADGTQTSVTAT